MLQLPFSSIQVLVNDNPITFEYHDSLFNSFYYGDEKITVLGAIEISVDPKEFKQNDIIFIKSSVGKLVNDGGDEGTVNAVAELERYTYGIGGPDTEFIEWNFGSIPGSVPDSRRFGYRQRVLAYELVEVSEYGLKYRIVDGIGNEKYTNGKLQISIVWESNSNKYAYDIVSFLTC